MRYKGKSTTNVGYYGTVTGKIMLKDNIMREFKLHNAGGNALFQFLVMCLAGEYSSVDSIRPTKIMLFNNTSLDNKSINNDLTPDNLVPMSSHSASNFLAMTSAPTIKDTSIALHFIIPFTNITQTNVNEICLYGASEQDVANYSAAFVIVDADGKVAPISASGQLSNMALLLDWELAFTSITQKTQQ